MKITYKTDITPVIEDIIGVYKSSGIKRPTDDSNRIEKMYRNSNLVVTAWNGSLLIGIARSLTDFCYCCYLSDLAVRAEYQKSGIGKQLVKITKDVIGSQSMLLLLAAPSAQTYYPKIGMNTVHNGFIIQREE
jgi:N-acetylglutamate synthase-like GNAT family acetyltransferase